MRTFLLFCLSLFSCAAHADALSRGESGNSQFPYAKPLQWRVVETRDHDAKRFTQGLAFHDRQLFESSGLYGRSALFVSDLRDGSERKVAQLLPGLFAEGLALWRDQLVMLTWREGIAQYFSLDGKPTMQRRFSGEGWGLTSDGKQLIMSDGSASLSFRDPESFDELRRVEVRDGSAPITRLNELEYARGHVFANIWQSDRIVRIDPHSGAVNGWLDLSTLKLRFEKPAGWNPADHVLNGIAYDPKADRFYVTGKCWPRMFVLAVGEHAAEQSPDGVAVPNR